MIYTCPVCGFPSLDELPRSESGGGSYEICPSCGFEFGYTDDDQGYSYEQWRKVWIKKGMKWRNEETGIGNPPPEWDPVKQLEGIGV
ncbi:MAG: hypothetical protein HYR79_04455 [Nitrospirae bacterium]|nr:hypothetical protein [Nitrospirota bacterium]